MLLFFIIFNKQIVWSTLQDFVNCIKIFYFIFCKKQLTFIFLYAIIVHALGICVKVAQQTLTLYVWVRILDPQPISTDSNAMFESVFFCFIRQIYLYVCSHKQTLHSCTISKAKNQYSQGIKHNFQSAI